MEWLLGLVVAFEVTFWQYVLSAGLGVVIGMVLIRIILPVTMLATFTTLAQKLHARMQRPVIA
jgi:hypothetical protein